jgi:IclR family acetate operon transcriptional repressor
MASAVRVLRVLEGLGEHQPVGLRELARTLDIPKSSVQRALDTLLAAGWAVRSESGAWSLTSRCALVGARAGDAGALRDLATSSMARLRRLCDESVRLWVRDGDRVVLVDTLESRQPVRYVSPPPGATLPLHASASGKAVLAHLPPPDVDDVLTGPLEALTERTITDPDELRRELARTRARGFAVTLHEASPDSGGVAAAITDAGGRAVGAISLTLPMHRLTKEVVARLGSSVAGEAASISGRFAGVPAV